MASNKLFKDLNLKNKPSRNGFDLSSSIKFTAKCGELLPIWHRTVMPGDSFKINLESITRTRPVQTAAFTSIKEYFDVFFVPYRLLGKQIPHILAQDKDNPVQATSSTSNHSIGTSLPRISLNYLRGVYDAGILHANRIGTKVNEFGFYRSVLSSKLLNHLGYCWQSTKAVKKYSGIDLSINLSSSETYSSNNFVSLLPLAAYQKIYYDYYRNTQWEDNVPYNYNFDYLTSTGIFSIPAENLDYWNNSTLFDLRYSNYPKDLFFGLLPDSQYGDTAVVDIDFSGDFNQLSDVTDTDGNVIKVGTQVVNQYGHSITGDGTQDIDGTLSVSVKNQLESLKGHFDILEFRKSRMTQRYREILGSGKKTYASIIDKVFGVNTPSTLTDECMYLGGHTQYINIRPVENTNLSGDNLATQRGKGLGSGNGSLIDFESKEYGCLMIIYHAVPQIDFALNAFHFDTLKISVDDFANPLFDKLGFQDFPVYYLDNTSKNNVSQTPFIGYTSRYFDYKTGTDMVVGDFRETLYTWVAPLTPDLLFQYCGTNDQRPGIVLDYRFFKVNPSILDSIFDVGADSYIDTDQLRVSTKFSIHAVRNIDYLGIPTN